MKLQKIKLNNLSSERMANREMNKVKGGSDCICGCRYVNSGGSSNSSNGGANNASDYYSPGGGTWYP